MKYSVLLSLYDRDIVDLQKTYKQLAKAASGNEEDVEFCIVYDFAEGEFEELEVLTQIFDESTSAKVTIDRYHTLEKHPDTFNLNGHNNPVAVNNHLMSLASGDNLVWVSSDMIVSPLLFDRLDLHLNNEGILDTVWCSRVLDQDAMAEYCGPSRPFPMMWCVAHPAFGTLKFDLNLLNGFGFDDNDWMAQVALRVGSVTIDLLHVAVHQTHGRVATIGQLASGQAYSIDAQPGWEKSIAYMKSKWGGNPFDGKTLDVEMGQVGDFLVLNVNGVKAGPEYPIVPKATPIKKKRARRSKKKAVVSK